MKFREGEEVVIVRSAYKCGTCGKDHGRYYHKGEIEKVGLRSHGQIIRVDSEEKILLRLKDGREWLVHPDELDILDKTQLAKLRRLLPGIESLPRHPVFEIAEQAPVFIVGEKVYSVGTGKVSKGEYLFEQKKRTGVVRKPLTEVGDLNSLDALTIDRADSEMAKIGEAYVKEAQKEVKLPIAAEL